MTPARRCSVAYLVKNQLFFLRTIQNGVIPGVDQRVLQVGKTVKYCMYCHCDFHMKDKYHNKLSHPRINSLNNNLENGIANPNGKCKRQQTNICKNNSTLNVGNNNASIFAIRLKMRYFMATSTSSS